MVQSSGSPRHDGRDVLGRVRGCLLAGAIGDALGAPVEFLGASEIARRWGPHGPAGYVEGPWPAGSVTDDTQMTLFTAEGLIRVKLCADTKGPGHPPGLVHHAYLRWLHTQGESVPEFGTKRGWPDGWLVEERWLHDRRAPGTTCLSGLRAFRGELGRRAANDSKGCGGVMRMAPAGLLDLAPSLLGAFDSGCVFAAITHGHPTGWLAAGTFAEMCGHLFRGEGLRAAVDASVRTLAAQPEAGETLRCLEAALAAAEGDEEPAQAVARLGQGWVADEALAIGLYAALVAPDLRTGLRIAVNHGGDSDSTGSIAGNLLGAIHGIEGIPADLLEGLEGRETIDVVAQDLVHHLLARTSPPTEDLARYPPW